MGPAQITTPIAVTANTMTRSVNGNDRDAAAVCSCRKRLQWPTDHRDLAGVVSITTTNTDTTKAAWGILSDWRQFHRNAQQTNVTSSGPNSDAGQCVNGGRITLNGGSASYTRVTPHPHFPIRHRLLLADGPGSLVTANSVSISTTNATTAGKSHSFSFGVSSRNSVVMCCEQRHHPRQIHPRRCQPSRLRRQRRRALSISTTSP